MKTAQTFKTITELKLGGLFTKKEFFPGNLSIVKVCQKTGEK